MTKSLVVSDSSSLILVTKAGLLSILCKEFEVEIPERVFEETVTAGRQFQKVDSIKIDETIREKKIKVKKVNKENNVLAKQLAEFNLGEGEKEAILLYRQVNAKVLLIDDLQGIKMAKLINLNWTTVPKLVTGFVKGGKISKKQGLEALRVIQLAGRYRLDFILDAMNEIEKLNEVKP